MRIRSTKPEFWRSKRISAVSWDARLVLKGLESYVDDNGVGKDDLELIVGDIFSRDVIREASRTLARVSEAISELHQAGLVWRYEADGNELLYISFWETAQRVDKPQAGRFPRPDGTLNYRDSQIREPGENPREASRTFAPGTGEQGNRGTGKERAAREQLRPIPDDWQPNLTHRAKLTNLVPGIDLDHEAEQFRQHALSTGRECASWDAAFHTWLGRARPKARPGVGAATTKAEGWVAIANAASDLTDDGHEQRRALG
ncbi:hypothetical protein [Williamsia serinedens]|uniref:Helix-turn-helix protein n=1 Tax=Williamsia serinedens TaxID=391736 RepID=A0ABT1H6A1_9NOCA|nr:hypothetical protein [Williamsia serinedens]MCP2162676.1 hypothetical protein [Williamsia serinedens]